jgi:hypothetical protein
VAFFSLLTAYASVVGQCFRFQYSVQQGKWRKKDEHRDDKPTGMMLDRGYGNAGTQQVFRAV